MPFSDTKTFTERVTEAVIADCLDPDKTRLGAKDKEDDKWCGEYKRLGGFDLPGRHEHVNITKDKDGYRISLKGYEQFSFVEVKPGVLKCKTLGTITQGSLKFEGREAVQVLTADFCYEQFYLFGRPAGKTIAK
jgi:hypothetical protein